MTPDGTVVEPAGTDPDRIGPYRLLGRLGAGAMGQVYLAVAPDESRVAVKVVHLELCHDEEFRQRFAREIELGRRLDAPWTARVLAADPGARQPWLATQYVPGLALDEAVDGVGVLPRDAVHVLARRLAEALAAIHAGGLLHRDIKPSNVLLAQDGPYLIDFGIAKTVDGTQLTGTGMIIGTPAYMSPEQADGARLTQASDVFSLGGVLVMAPPAPGRSARRRRSCCCGASSPHPRTWAPSPNRCAPWSPAAWPAIRPSGPPRPSWPPRSPRNRAPPARAGCPPRWPPGSSTCARRPSRRPQPPPPPPWPKPSPVGCAAARYWGRGPALTVLAGAGAGLATLLRPRPVLRWSHTAGSDITRIATDGATVFVQSEAATVEALDTVTGRPRWSHVLDEQGSGRSFPLVAAGPIVYASAGDTYALDATSGTQRWTTTRQRLLAADVGTVILAGFDPYISANVSRVDPATGVPRWTHRLEGGRNDPYAAAAALTRDTVVVVQLNRLVTLDAGTGAPLWRRQLDDDFLDGVLLAAPDTAYYLPSSTAKPSNRVLALAARTGDERWQDADGPHGTLPGLVADGALYCARYDEATAWDAATGALRWRWTELPKSFSAEPYAQQLRGATRAGDTVVLLGDLTTAVGATERRFVVVALDLRDGSLRWRLELPLSRSSATAGPVALADGSVAVGTGPVVHRISV